METIERILEKCSSICRKTENVKVYKDNCDTLASRVRTLERLVKGIQAKGPDHITPTVSQSLLEVLMTLTTAEEHITKFTRLGAFKGSAKSKDNEEMFSKISKKIDDGFQILNGAQTIDSPVAAMPFTKQATYPAGPMFSPLPQPNHTLQMHHSTQQFNIAASMPPPPQPLYPTASLHHQTQQINPSFLKPMSPTFQMSNHMTTVPLHSTNPSASFSGVSYGFTAPQQGQGYYTNAPGAMTSMPYPTPMNISHQSTSIATNYVVNHPTFQ